MTNNRRAAALIVASMAMISSNDAILKLSTEDLGVGQILFIRGAFAAMIFAVIIRISGRRILDLAVIDRSNLARAVFECLATFCFVTSLAILPIATASTLVWTAPILLTLASALFLREAVTISRWAAVLAGFAGVVLVTRPGGTGFSPAMLLPLAAAALVVCRDLITRRLDPSIHSAHVVLATLVLVSVAGGCASLFNWRQVALENCAWLLVSGVLLSLGFYGNIRAIRIGELSFIAPFLFTGILVAIFWGYLIWGEKLNLSMAVGIAMIIGSGMVILRSGGDQVARESGVQPR